MSFWDSNLFKRLRPKREKSSPSTDSPPSTDSSPVRGHTEFKNGTPVRMHVSMDVKMGTLPYESVAFGASISMDLDKTSTVSAAYDEGWEFLETVLKPRIQAVRKKYPR